jgi:hypothetical protein
MQTMNRLLAAGLLAMAALVPAHAQDPATFDRESPGDLFDRSWNSSSQVEKGIIRGYLAKKSPSTRKACSRALG